MRAGGVGGAITAPRVVSRRTKPLRGSPLPLQVRADWGASGDSALSDAVCASENEVLAAALPGMIPVESPSPGEWMVAQAKSRQLLPKNQPGVESPYRLIGTGNPDDPPVKMYFYHVDHLGTPRVITDEDGQFVEEHKYLPFGEEMGSLGSMSSHQYTGHERDGETGIDYMLARYYQSDSGRFYSVDPSSGSIDEGNPQTWNRYAYVINAPLQLVDPDGMSFLGFKGSGFAGGGYSGVSQVFTDGCLACNGSYTNHNDMGGQNSQGQWNTPDMVKVTVTQADGTSSSGTITPGGYKALLTLAANYQTIGAAVGAAEALSRISTSNLGGLTPAFRQKVETVLLELAYKGYRPKVAEGLRTIAQQRQKIKDGFSPIGSDNPYSPRASKHLWGNAADVIDRRWGWNTPGGRSHPFWSDLGNIAIQNGLKWGGNWASKDVAHIEVP